MNNTQQLIKQKRAAMKRRELSQDLSKRFGRDTAASLDVFVAQEISQWTKEQIVMLRNQRPSPFMRLDAESLVHTLDQKFSEILPSQIFVTFAQWEDAGAILLRKEEFLANAIHLISFDGDGYFGCSKEKDAIFSVDYDPDYPYGGEYEILTMKI